MDMLATVLGFLRRTGLPETLFGRLAINDPRLVADMRRGRDLRPETRARIECFIRANADVRYVSPGPGRPAR
jgi:hypothetical protein